MSGTLLYRRQGVGAPTPGMVGSSLYAEKTANDPRANVTAPADDVDLFLTVAASAIYLIDPLLLYEGDTPAGDLKIQWTAPAGATFDWYPGGISATAGTATASGVYGSKTLADNVIIGTIGAAAGLGARPYGILKTAAAAGTFRLQWAQGTASAVPTILYARSFLRAYRQS